MLKKKKAAPKKEPKNTEAIDAALKTLTRAQVSNWGPNDEQVFLFTKAQIDHIKTCFEQLK